jgi:hypothetical protein
MKAVMVAAVVVVAGNVREMRGWALMADANEWVGMDSG